MCTYNCALKDVSWPEADVRADAMTGKWSQSIRFPEMVVVVLEEKRVKGNSNNAKASF